MPESSSLVRVFITTTALATGEIEAAWAEIHGDCCRIQGPDGDRTFPGEGTNWHRTKWAAEHYARQAQATYLEHMRASVARVEGYRFGRPGS